MNYEAHYNLLMEQQKGRLLEGYSERHHIIPRCMGGTDDADNIAILTAEEHYVAHQLLVKMYPGHRGLAYAAILMSTGHLTGRSKNKSYGWLKARYSESCKGRIPWNKGKKTGPLSAEHKNKIVATLTGYKHSEEAKANMSKAGKGRKFTEEHRAKIGAAHKGMKMPPGTGAKISAALTGGKLSMETRAKMSAAHLGKPKMWLRGRPAQNMKKIMIDGIVYKSRTHAANDLNKDRSTIYNWIRNGKAMNIEVTE